MSSRKWVKPYSAGPLWGVKHASYDARRWLALRWKRWTNSVYEWIWP